MRTRIHSKQASREVRPIFDIQTPKTNECVFMKVWQSYATETGIQLLFGSERKNSFILYYLPYHNGEKQHRKQCGAGPELAKKKYGFGCLADSSQKML